MPSLFFCSCDLIGVKDKFKGKRRTKQKKDNNNKPSKKSKSKGYDTSHDIDPAPTEETGPKVIAIEDECSNSSTAITTPVVQGIVTSTITSPSLSSADTEERDVVFGDEVEIVEEEQPGNSRWDDRLRRNLLQDASGIEENDVDLLDGDGGEGEMEEEDNVQWKALFMKYHRTKKNWDTGKYTLETLTHHKNTVRCVQFDAHYNMITARYLCL
jgi:hypothetical protein